MKTIINNEKLSRKIFSFCILLFTIFSANAQFVTTFNNNTPYPLNVHGAVYLGHGAYIEPLNTAVGEGSLASLNPATFPYGSTGCGYHTINNNTNGRDNTALGAQALEFGMGSSNVAVGRYALQSGTAFSSFATGSYNTSVGFGSMRNILDGVGNCAFGAGGALWNNPSGNYNTAMGYGALGFLTSGDNNVGIGQNANVANGSNQLSIQNVIYGINMNGTSTGNIGIGISTPTQQFHTTRGVRFQGLTTSPGGASAITRLVGADATGVLWASSLPVLCQAANNIPKTLNAAGDMICSQIFDNGVSVGINQNAGFGYVTGATLALGTPTPPANFRLAVNGWTSSTAFVALSDQRIKKDIKKIENPLDKISKINGYTYFWNKEYTKTRQLDDNKQAGFLAQEVLKVLPEAVVKSEDGLYGLNYNAIMPLLAEGIKEQQSQIETQQLKIEELETKVNELSNKLNRLVPGEVKIKNSNFDITPNPITGISTVSYKLDNASASSYLAVYDLQGKLLKQINLAKNTNEGQVQIRKTDFKNGMYILALISNNNEIESKRFIISQ